jgi:23S rRNA-/tRNA-specific pseudouridylate synthase
MKITVREPGILFDLLLDKLKPISKSRVRKLAQNGHIFLDGEPVARVDRVLQPGQTLEIRNPRKEKTSAPFPILFEDNWLIVVEKPAGVLSMNKEDDKTDTFLYAVNQALRQRPRNRKRAYLVHRLDRESSGVMLFAFSPEIKRALQENWDKTEKLYYALVEGRPHKRKARFKAG